MAVYVKRPIYHGHAWSIMFEKGYDRVSEFPGLYGVYI